MKSSADLHAIHAVKLKSNFQIFLFFFFSQIAKFKNLATSKKCANLCVSSCSRYFLYTLLCAAFIHSVQYELVRVLNSVFFLVNSPLIYVQYRALILLLFHYLQLRVNQRDISFLIFG